MIKYWKEIVIVILLGLLVFSQNERQELVEEITTKTTEVSNLQKQIKEKSNVEVVERIVIQKKDGTVITKDKSTVKKTEVKTEVAETKKIESIEDVKRVITNKSKWSVGVSYPVLSRDFSAEDFSVQAGTRIFSTPFWLEAGYNNRNGDVSIGVKFEF